MFGSIIVPFERYYQLALLMKGKLKKFMYNIFSIINTPVDVPNLWFVPYAKQLKKELENIGKS